jgi:hypothetical protein
MRSTCMDTRAIRRGMGLNRNPETGWDWLVNAAPAG